MEILIEGIWVEVDAAEYQQYKIDKANGTHRDQGDIMLIEKLNGYTKRLKSLSSLMYDMTKLAAKNSFREFREDCGVSIQDWDIFKEFLKENGIDTYL